MLGRVVLPRRRNITFSKTREIFCKEYKEKLRKHIPFALHLFKHLFGTMLGSKETGFMAKQ